MSDDTCDVQWIKTMMSSISWCKSARIRGLRAVRFFKKKMKGQGRPAREIVTDKLPSYGTARKAIMSTAMHCDEHYVNNRAEFSHEHTQAQKRKMRQFKSPGQAQRFLAIHSQVHNLFRVRRHLLRVANYRLLRNRSFEAWQQVSCAC